MTEVLTFAIIGAAIANTIRGNTTLLKQVQNFTELTETIPDTPMAQVYPESGAASGLSDNDRKTFQAGVRISDVTFMVDVFGHARSALGQDLGIAFRCLDEIYGILEAQKSKAYFGLPGIKEFSWSWERATITYNNVDYAGIRLSLKLRIY